jgi:histo-blood group ABO system transferase
VSIAVVIIATGEKYTPYAGPLIASLKKFFPPHQVFLFTDGDYRSNDSQAEIIKHQHEPWPRPTLMRYHMMLKLEDILRSFEYVFYIDADMLAVSKIDADEILSDGITAVLHGGFPTTFERRWQSTAYVPEIITKPYYQGSIVGGLTAPFLQMCGRISRNIDADESNGIVAIWHDESHLNRYLWVNPPSKVLSPAFCYSAGVKVKVDVPKIIHIEKPGQETWKTTTK